MEIFPIGSSVDIQPLSNLLRILPETPSLPTLRQPSPHPAVLNSTFHMKTWQSKVLQNFKWCKDPCVLIWGRKSQWLIWSLSITGLGQVEIWKDPE